MILTCSQMRALEESAFAAGITAEALMEEAGLRIAEAVRQFFPGQGRCIVALGKGHNGGDGLVAARHLQAAGWEIDLQPAFPVEEWAPLTRLQRGRLPSGDATIRATAGTPLIVLDGLLGIGAGGALREPIRGACRKINRLRSEENAHVFAIDIPTGLDGNTGVADADAVIADTTFTIGFAKSGLLADSAINHVGRLAVLPLSELSKRAPHLGIPEAATVANAATLAGLLPRRQFDTHKGQCGRVGIAAGSRGFVGAAILCAEGAVRGGAGLVSLYVMDDIYSIVASRVAPEVMVRPVSALTEALTENLDAIAIGPGLGKSHASAVLELIERAPQPMVVDADALNILAADISALDRCVGPRLLTPHPGEMARLDPESTSRTRAATVEAFTTRCPHTLLLKGARTIVAERGRPLSHNSTGHPGLATGGVGDVMTGLLAGLAGQGLALYDAARLGSWLTGRAAEIAIFGGAESQETLRPTVLLNELGRAFADLRIQVW
jgi:NAD(P)H-hydrate epimerase